MSDLVESWPWSTIGLQLHYRFRLAFPGSGVPLPYQDGAFCAGAAIHDLTSSLVFHLHGNCHIDLVLPFEAIGHAFVRYHDEIRARLGGRQFRSLRRHAPNAAGDRLLVEGVRFNRAAYYLRP